VLLKTVVAATFATLAISTASAADLTVRAAKPIIDVPFFIVNDNRLTYSYIFTGTDPSVTNDTAKHSYTHFDTWAYGTNLLNISMFKSDHADPTNGCNRPNQDCAGATGIYGVLRSTFGFNQIFNTNVFTVGPLHNVSFELSADFNDRR
jgi:hypothetical protein